MEKNCKNLNLSLFLTGSLSKLCWSALLVMGLSACATNSSYSVPSQPKKEVEVIINDDALALPNDDLPVLKPLPKAEIMSPVVRKLLDQAHEQRLIGNESGAAMRLERALRIEPRNAIVWSKLADIRFDQQAWGKAVQLAAKSNTLAANRTDLKRRNWVLMANAYEKLGDEASAKRILDKLSQ